NEGKLLLATLLYCYRHYRMVRDITLLILSEKDLKEKKEFIFLKCLSLSWISILYQSRFDYIRAYIEGSKAIRIYSDDPRFHNMFGTIIRRGISLNLEKKKTLDDAIQIYQNALDRCTIKDNMLKAAIKSNIAYSIVLKVDHTMEELNYANELIKEMEKLWSRDNWIIDFWSIEGFVQFNIAELTDDPSEKKIYLKKAHEKLIRARNLGEKYKIATFMMNKIQRRLENVERRLEKLKYFST
ncbi:MAG: hypothetical protein ACE5K0_05975, partial [Candidatus Methanofastidiosia archaeon]